MKNFLVSNKVNFAINIILTILLILVSTYCYDLRIKMNLIIQEQKLISKNTPQDYSWQNVPTLPLPQGVPILTATSIYPIFEISKFPTSSPEYKLELEERNRQSEIFHQKLIEDQKKFEEIKESLIGCFYGEELRMGKIQLHRNAYFYKYTQTLASSTKYSNLDGTYDASSLLELQEITLIPNSESKFKMRLFTKDKEISLIDASNNYYTKGDCTDFSPYNY